MNSKLVSFLKFFCIVYLVVLIPKIISFYTEKRSREPFHQFHALLGVENFIEMAAANNRLKTVAYGLISDQGSVNRSGKRSVDLLRDNGFHIVASIDQNDILTNPSAVLGKQGDAIETWLLDSQDEGIATKTTATFLENLLNFVAESGKKLVVLDRPTLLGGVIEGPGAVPWRHGLTIGELAHYCNRYILSKQAALTVIPLKRWRRGNKMGGNRVASEFSYFLRPFNYIRPIFSSFNHQRAFHSLLFAEKERLSKWESRYLKRICWHLGLHCLDYFSSVGGNATPCYGIRLSLKADASKFSAFNAFITIMRFLKNRKQISIEFKEEFDQTIGARLVKDFLNGVIPFNVLKEDIEGTVHAFYDRAKHCCIYKPLPRIITPKIIKV